MISDTQLIENARSVLNPRRLSPTAEAAGVGAALLTDKGNVYLGVCIDVACGIGFCAEHAAIAAMVTAGETRIVTAVAVNWDGQLLSPCGRCREFMLQVDAENRDTRVLLRGNRVARLIEMLPDYWADEATR